MKIPHLLSIFLVCTLLASCTPSVITYEPDGTIVRDYGNREEVIGTGHDYLIPSEETETAVLDFINENISDIIDYTVKLEFGKYYKTENRKGIKYAPANEGSDLEDGSEENIEWYPVIADGITCVDDMRAQFYDIFSAKHDKMNAESYLLEYKDIDGKAYSCQKGDTDSVSFNGKAKFDEIIYISNDRVRAVGAFIFPDKSGSYGAVYEKKATVDITRENSKLKVVQWSITETDDKAE